MSGMMSLLRVMSGGWASLSLSWEDQATTD